MRRLALITLTLCISLFAWAKPKPDSTSPRTAIDGEQVYKTNCTRCHNTPPSLTERETRVIARHMRVRANLLADQADAVLQYLTETARRK